MFLIVVVFLYVGNRVDTERNPHSGRSFHGWSNERGIQSKNGLSSQCSDRVSNTILSLPMCVRLAFCVTRFSFSVVKWNIFWLCLVSFSTVQFGIPTISAGAVGAMMAAIVASMLDSCGDYIAYARTMGYPLPPKHAVNRGIAMEGLATIISGKNQHDSFSRFQLIYLVLQGTTRLLCSHPCLD